MFVQLETLTTLRKGTLQSTDENSTHGTIKDNKAIIQSLQVHFDSLYNN